MSKILAKQEDRVLFIEVPSGSMEQLKELFEDHIYQSKDDEWGFFIDQECLPENFEISDLQPILECEEVDLTELDDKRIWCFWER